MFISPNVHSDTSSQEQAGECNPTTTTATAGRQGRERTLEAKSQHRRRLRKVLALVWGEKTRAEDIEEWAMGYFCWRGEKKHWVLLPPFSRKVRSESSSHWILGNHTVSNLSNLISPLYIFGSGEPFPVLSQSLRDFLSVEAVPTNCIMTNGGLNIVGACCCRTSDSVSLILTQPQNSQSNMTISRACFPANAPRKKKKALV